MTNAPDLKVINMTPTWGALLPLMCAVLESDSASYSSKQAVKDELARLARAVDTMNASDSPDGTLSEAGE